MKNIKFLFGLFSIVIIMASCATTQGIMNDEDDYSNDPRTEQVGNRLYVQDPFYGTIILERNPYTGRYYDITNGSRFGTGFYGGYPYYGGGYRGGYNRGYVGRGGVVQQAPSRPAAPQNRDEVRQKVLGN